MVDSNKDDESKYFSKRPNTKAKSKNVSVANRNKSRSEFKDKVDNIKQSKISIYSYSKSKRPVPNKSALILMGGVTFLAILLIFIFTHKNAYEVYLSEELIGTIKMDKTTTEESFYNTAVSKLSEKVGSKVSVKQTIELVPVHASGKEIATHDYVLGEMYDKWIYTVEAFVITVDGVEMGALKSQAEAQAVLDEIAGQYVGEGATLVSYEFLEDVKIEPKFVGPETVGTIESVTEAMKKSKDVPTTYKIKSGDTISLIASKNDITSEELLSLNQGLNPNSLVIGQEINLVTKVPMATARTKENIISVETVEKPVQQRENPNRDKNYSKVVSEGKDGKAEITTQIIRINGVEESSEVVNTKEIEKPIPEIVEVGVSGDASPDGSDN